VSAESEATRVVLVRHGESKCNADGVVGGQRGCTGLTPDGVDQVAALADRLAATGELGEVAALYASTLPRAIETAEILRPALERGGAALPVIVEHTLREMEPGEADGLTWREVDERWGPIDPEVVDRPWAPGCEAWLDFAARAAGAVERVADAHPGRLVVIACHGGVIEASLVRFLPSAPGGGRLGLRPKYASMTEWEREDGRWVLLRYNDGGEGLGPRL